MLATIVDPENGHFGETSVFAIGVGTGGGWRPADATDKILELQIQYWWRQIFNMRTATDKIFNVPAAIQDWWRQTVAIVEAPPTVHFKAQNLGGMRATKFLIIQRQISGSAYE